MAKAITAKQAERICKRIGLALPGDDGRTFFAANKDETEIWVFDSKRERDAFVRGCE